MVMEYVLMIIKKSNGNTNRLEFYHDFIIKSVIVKSLLWMYTNI